MFYIKGLNIPVHFNIVAYSVYLSVQYFINYYFYNTWEV